MHKLLVNTTIDSPGIDQNLCHLAYDFSIVATCQVSPIQFYPLYLFDKISLCKWCECGSAFTAIKSPPHFWHTWTKKYTTKSFGQSKGHLNDQVILRGVIRVTDRPILTLAVLAHWSLTFFIEFRMLCARCKNCLSACVLTVRRHIQIRQMQKNLNNNTVYENLKVKKIQKKKQQSRASTTEKERAGSEGERRIIIFE